MGLVFIFSTAFLVGLSGALMPGPLLTVTVGESARRGFIAGPLLVMGHGLLEGLLVLALALGLFSVFHHPLTSKVVALIGGSFLIYMAWGMIRDAWSGRLKFEPRKASEEVATVEEVSQDPPATGLKLVWTGMLVSLSNPYWSLWWATVGLSYITLSLQHGNLGLLSFFSGHVLSDLVWYSLVAAVVAGGRRFLTPPLYRGLILGCGLFLVFLGGSFILWGFRI